MRRSARIARDLLVPAPPATTPAIQRACACGEPAGLTGRCAGCEGRERLAVQPKLTVGSPGDRFEQEADRIADRVTAPANDLGTSPLLQRQSLGPDRDEALLQRMPQEDEEDVVQAKGVPGKGPAQPSTRFTQRLASETQGGQPLDRATTARLEPQLGRDLSPIRLHTSPQAAALSRSIKARAFTHKNHIFFGAGQYNPSSGGGQHLLVHEIAHSLQQQPGMLRRKTLADLDKKIRKKLRVSRLAPKASDLDARVKEFFDPKQGTSFGLSQPIEFSKNITEKNEQKGLTSLAGKIVFDSTPRKVPSDDGKSEVLTNTDSSTWPLPPNHVLDLALDLRPYGHEHAIYRFVRYNVDEKTEKVLVVKTKVIAAAKSAAASTAGGAADTKASPAEAKPDSKAEAGKTPASGKASSSAAAASYTGKVKVGNVTVEIDTGFGDAKGKIIADAIDLLPDPIRAKVDGVKIEDAGTGQGPGGENGHYDPETDKVKLWGDLFKASHRRVGTASENAYQVVHELAHVIDLRPLFKAQRARDAAEKREKDLKSDLKKAEFERDMGTGELFDDRTDEEKAAAAQKVKDIEAEIDAVGKEIKKHEKGIRSAKSIAGDELGKTTAKLTTEFGKALKADGVKTVKNAVKKNRAAAKKDPPEPAVDTLKGGITDYAETDLMEAFAENFSYYILDEALLEALRPNTNKFFKKHFPKTSKGKGKP